MRSFLPPTIYSSQSSYRLGKPPLARLDNGAVTARMAARAQVFCLILVALVSTFAAESTPSLLEANVEPVEHPEQIDNTKKVDLQDGFYVEIPSEEPSNNGTEKLLSFGVDLNKDASAGRGKNKKLLQRILPMFIMPFLIQSAIIPMFLGALKFMLFKSMMVGKLALFLILVNAFKNHNSFKGRESEMADVHYGYHGNGMEEYGAYVN